MLSTSSRGLAASASLNAASSPSTAAIAALDRLGALGGVDEVHKRAGALEVAEEVDAQARRRGGRRR